MRAEFTENNTVLRVSNGASSSNVLLSIERPGCEGISVYLKPTLARALASALMGSAAELKSKEL